MSLLLLDTSIASDLVPGRPSRLQLLYASALRGHDCAICFHTQTELWQGAEEAGWGPSKREGLRRALDHTLHKVFREEC